MNTDSLFQKHTSALVVVQLMQEQELEIRLCSAMLKHCDGDTYRKRIEAAENNLNSLKRRHNQLLIQINDVAISKPASKEDAQTAIVAATNMELAKELANKN